MENAEKMITVKADIRLGVIHGWTVSSVIHDIHGILHALNDVDGVSVAIGRNGEITPLSTPRNKTVGPDRKPKNTGYNAVSSALLAELLGESQTAQLYVEATENRFSDDNVVIALAHLSCSSELNFRVTGINDKDFGPKLTGGERQFLTALLERISLMDTALHMIPDIVLDPEETIRSFDDAHAFGVRRLAYACEQIARLSPKAIKREYETGRHIPEVLHAQEIVLEEVISKAPSGRGSHDLTPPVVQVTLPTNALGNGTLEQPAESPSDNRPHGKKEETGRRETDKNVVSGPGTEISESVPAIRRGLTEGQKAHRG